MHDLKTKEFKTETERGGNTRLVLEDCTMNLFRTYLKALGRVLPLFSLVSIVKVIVHSVCKLLCHPLVFYTKFLILSSQLLDIRLGNPTLQFPIIDPLITFKALKSSFTC